MNIQSLLNKFRPDTLVAVINTHWLLLEKVITVPVGLLLTIALARYLGPEQFGVYSYLVSLVMLIVPLAELGLNSLISKQLVDTPNETQKILGSALFGRIIGGLLGTLPLLYFYWQGELEHSHFFLVLAIGQLFSALTIFNFWFQARSLNKIAVIARTSAILIGAVIKLVAIVFDQPLTFFVYAYAADFIIQGAFLYFAFLRRSNYKQLYCAFDLLSKLLSRSGWLIFSSIAATLNLKIDQVMLQHMVGSEEVGLYSVAARISEVWYFIPLALTAAFFPQLIQAKTESSSRYQSKLQQLNDVLLGLAICVILPVYLLAEWTIVLLFGEQYAASAGMLAIHIFAGCFVFMRALLSKWLITEDLLKFSLLSHGLGAAVNIAANYWLIPISGGKGAAWASLFSYAVSGYLFLFLFASTRPMAKVMSLSFLYPLRLVYHRIST